MAECQPPPSRHAQADAGENLFEEWNPFGDGQSEEISSNIFQHVPAAGIDDEEPVDAESRLSSSFTFGEGGEGEDKAQEDRLAKTI